MPDFTGEERSLSSEISSAPFWKRHILSIMIFIAVLGGLSVLVVFTYEKRKTSTIPAQVKIVKARNGPTKIKPENPGGMIIPDQDKEVYSRLNPIVENERVEHLLPTPEVVISDQKNAKNKSANKLEEIQSNKNPSNVPPLSKPTITQDNFKTGKKRVMNSKVVREIYRVQIASSRSEKNVKQYWLQIKTKYPKTFQNLKAFVVRARIEGKGTYFRLQLGSLNNSQSARELCQKIRNTKAGCFIVKSN